MLTLICCQLLVWNITQFLNISLHLSTKIILLQFKLLVVLNCWFLFGYSLEWLLLERDHWLHFWFSLSSWRKEVKFLHLLENILNILVLKLVLLFQQLITQLLLKFGVTFKPLLEQLICSNWFMIVPKMMTRPNELGAPIEEAKKKR